jgi:excisionase family DNA binding protein
MERLTMTVPEFAKATGISRNLAYGLAKQGKLPIQVIKLGRRMVLSRRAVERLFEIEDIEKGKPGNGQTSS